MIPFNRHTFTNLEKSNIVNSFSNEKISGDGYYSKECIRWFKQNLGNQSNYLLTPSGTHSLEMAALLLDIKPGDEVIMPSYTFVSTANAFVLRGAHIVFVDIRPDTMNINETLIEEAITNKTKAIVIVHYAGVSCEMNKILEISQSHSIPIVEDAAQAIGSFYQDKPLGTIGLIGCFSFHETKNITSAGEGGLLITNDEVLRDRSEIIREKGTNRNQFFRGIVDKYNWVDIGSSYLLNDPSAAHLLGQLTRLNEIQSKRTKLFERYLSNLKDLEDKGYIDLPVIPKFCKGNGHMFYLKVNNIDVRENLINFLKSKEIMAVFHYIPLHSSPPGQKFGRFHGIDNYTTSESERILRLPLYFDLSFNQVDFISQEVIKFYNS